MERRPNRKAKSASGVEGVRCIQEQKARTTLSLDSCSSVDGRSTSDDMFTLELGQSSLKRATGRPEPEFLEEEIYEGMKSKRKSCVIARLMCFGGLPSQHHVHREQKWLSACRQQKNASSDIQPRRKLYDNPSYGRSSMGQQELKDVYEDREASYFVSQRISSRWSASSMLTKSEVALIQQKFLDSKCVSTDEKLQDSKKLDDSLDSKHMLMKYFRQPGFFSANYLRNLRVNPRTCFGSHMSLLKPLNSPKCEDNSKACISERHDSSKSIDTDLKREDALLLERPNRHKTHISCKSLDIQFEVKNEKKMLPMEIVLKHPNDKDMENDGMAGSSHDRSCGYVPNIRRMKECQSVGSGETVSCRRKNSSCNVGFLKVASKETTEIAKEITRRMRDAYDETVDAKSSAFRGYAGDGSSFCTQRKRLSERWKKTQRYQDLEIVPEGTRLGDMFAIPERQTGPIHLNAKTHLGRENARHGDNIGSTKWEGLSGISCRDGMKDEIHRKSSRSRSLSPIGGRSNRKGAYHDKLAEKKHMMHIETVHYCRSQVGNGNLSHEEIFSSQDSKTRSRKPLLCPHINKRDFSAEANFEIGTEAKFTNLSERQLISQHAAEDDCHGSLITDLMIAEHESKTFSSKSCPLNPIQSYFLENDKAAIYDQVNFHLQELHKGPPEECSSLCYLGAEFTTSESSKMADHASPVSVLKVSLTENASFSSESFKRVNVELHELRMQLHLLKMESAAHPEVFALGLMEEDNEQLTSTPSEGKCIFGAEGWEVFYVLDVLIQSALQEFCIDKFRIMWYSSDCPLDPMLFENLEKRYGDKIIGTRSERKLLFDRINSSLLEIFQQDVDSYPWVTPKLGALHSTWQKEWVSCAPEKSFNQKSANGQVMKRVLDTETQWSDPKREIDIIGKEIEKLLIDDMITDLSCI